MARQRKERMNGAEWRRVLLRDSCESCSAPIRRYFWTKPGRIQPDPIRYRRCAFCTATAWALRTRPATRLDSLTQEGVTQT